MRLGNSFLEIATVALLLGNCASMAAAGDGAQPLPAACATQPIGSGSSQRFESTPLMTIAKEVESQGESDFHVKFDEPTAECLVESFSITDVRLIARYNPWEKGTSTLLYRFSVERPTGASEVLVIYSGMASFLAGGGYVFHVSEEKGGVISWYAMYRDNPAYPAGLVEFGTALDLGNHLEVE